MLLPLEIQNQDHKSLWGLAPPFLAWCFQVLAVTYLLVLSPLHLEYLRATETHSGLTPELANTCPPQMLLRDLQDSLTSLVLGSPAGQCQASPVYKALICAHGSTASGCLPFH